jgi:RNA recognition motif-containing protein
LAQLFNNTTNAQASHRIRIASDFEQMKTTRKVFVGGLPADTTKQEV